MRDQTPRHVHDNGVDRAQEQANEGDGYGILNERRDGPDCHFKTGEEMDVK